MKRRLQKLARLIPNATSPEDACCNPQEAFAVQGAVVFAQIPADIVDGLPSPKAASLCFFCYDAGKASKATVAHSTCFKKFKETSLVDLEMKSLF